MTFLMASETADYVTRILLLVLLGSFLVWNLLRDYRLVSHWEYKIWDMRRGTERKDLEREINRMKDLGEEGWECYAVLKMPDEGGIVRREYHFKRKRSVLHLGFQQTKTGAGTDIKVELKKE